MLKRSIGNLTFKQRPLCPSLCDAEENGIDIIITQEIRSRLFAAIKQIIKYYAMLWKMELIS